MTAEQLCPANTPDEDFAIVLRHFITHVLHAYHPNSTQFAIFFLCIYILSVNRE